MRFDHEFSLDLPIAQAWAVVTDIERIAPCMPGAQLESVEGNSYSGSVKVRVGPITTQYRGVATIVEQDAANYRLVLDGKGADTFGQGNAAATVVGQLTEVNGRTRVNLATDLQISGKVAQLGQSVMKDVSARLLKQFVANLEKQLAAQSAQGTPPPAAAAAAAGTVRKIEAPAAEAIDVLGLGAGSVLRQYGLGLTLALIVLLQLLILYRQ